MNYCEKCMRPLDASGICPVCGVLNPAPLYHLKPGTVLRKKYWIGRAVAEEPQVIIYLGRDLTQDSVIILYEFFPAGQVVRSHLGSNTVEEAHFQEKAMERFLTKADILSKFADDPHVMKVTDFFRDNNTAYVVTEKISGVSVQTYLQKKGSIPSKSLLELMEPVFKALGKLHTDGVIHGRISPENIRLYPDGNIKLTNFAMGQSVSSTPNHGYAPLECYKGEKCGPWSDIYSLCAVLYHSITGICPQPAEEREKSDLLLRPSLLGVAIEERQETALMLGLEVRAENRLQTVDVMMRVMGLVEEEPEAVVIKNETRKVELTGMPVLEGVDETAERPIDPVEHHGRPSQNLSVYTQPKAELKEEPQPVTDRTMINIPGMPKFELSKGREPEAERPKFELSKGREPEVERPKFELSKGREPEIPELEATRGIEPELPVFGDLEMTILGEPEPVTQRPKVTVSQPQTERPRVMVSEPILDFGFDMSEDERTVMAPEGYDIPRAVPTKKKSKKNLWIAISAGAVALLAAVFACLFFFTDLFKGKEESKEPELSFTLAEEEYTLPVEASELFDAGWNTLSWFKDEQGNGYGLNDELEEGTDVAGLLTNDGQEIYIHIINTDKESKPLQECDVVYVRVTGNGADLELSGGITTRSTMEEAEKVFDGKKEENVLTVETKAGTISLKLDEETPENSAIAIATKDYKGSMQ